MNAIDVLMYGQRTIVSTMQRYGHDDWSRTALGVWSAKDLLGHLGAFEVRFADALAPFLGVPLESDLIAADRATFNDDQAAIRKDWTIERITDEYVTAHERVMSFARELPSTVWSAVGTIPWYGPEYSLDDLVVYTMYGHKREHDPQLSAVLENGGPGR